MKFTLAKKLLFFTSLLALKVVLTIVYHEFFITRYGYYGFSAHPVSLPKSLINWFIFLLCSASLTFLTRTENISLYILTILYCVSYIPCYVYFEQSDAPVMFLVQLHIYWFLLLFLVNILPDISLRFSRSNEPNAVNQKRQILGSSVIILLAIYAVVTKVSFNGLYIQTDLESVYDLRIQAANYNFGSFSGYLISWACLAFTIRGVIAFSNSRYVIMIIFLLLQVIIFSIAGHKFYLFALPVAIILSGIYREGLVFFIPVLFIGALIVAKLLNDYYNFFFFIYMIPFRQMFLPALITGNFLDFFANHAPDFLTQSILGRFGFESDYDLPLPYLIDFHYGDGTASANTGLVADAVSNFGFFGVFIYPILFSVVLKMLDSSSKHIYLGHSFGIIVFFSVSFINTAFFTALLTGGVLFILIFLKTQSSATRNKFVW